MPLTARQQQSPTAAALDVRKFEAIEALVRDEIGQKRLPGRRRPDRRRRPHRLSEGDRQPGAGAVGRADDARHDLRRRLADQGRGDDDERDDADRAGQAAPDRSRGDVHSRVRALRQGRHHHPPPADARVRPRPDVDLGDEWAGTDAAIQLAVEEVPTAPPGTRFVYSDINFFLLGEIVRRVSGQPLDEFAQERDLRAARHEGHDVQSAGVAARRGSRRPRAARRTAGRATARTRRCCAASCTIRPRGGWAASPATPGCSAPPPTWRSSAACCSTAARTAARGSSRRSTVAKMTTPATPSEDRNVRGARLGHRLAATRPTAASCCRSARSATPASPARRSGSIRRRGCSSCSCRTASIRTARATSRRCARGSRRSPRRRIEPVPASLAHGDARPGATSAPAAPTLPPGRRRRS